MRNYFDSVKKREKEALRPSTSQRRDRLKRLGLCTQCGGPRDRSPLLLCVSCETKYGWRARNRSEQPELPAPVELKQPWSVVHQFISSIPAPPRGFLAYQMAWHKRTEAAGRLRSGIRMSAIATLTAGTHGQLKPSGEKA